MFSCFALSDSFSVVPRASCPIFIFCSSKLIFGGTEGVGSRFVVLRSRTHFVRYRGRQILFLCFALSDSFGIVPRVLGPVFKFCALGLVLEGTKGLGSRFHVLYFRTRSGRYRGRRVQFSRFAPPDSFGVVARASDPVFLFCPHRLIFSCTEGVGYRFHVLRSHTHFQRYRWRRVPFACFAHPD
jgi:hypothetical protein